MYAIDLNKRSIGVSFNEHGDAEILLWAPNASHAEISIGNRVAIPLIRREEGYWQLSTNLLKPGDMYSFVIDGDKKYPDPASLAQPQGVHGASQALDPGFSWHDKDWNNIPLDEYIFYELHTGTFTPEGTFDAIIGKLPYLKELGVNAIELMPVAQFPGKRNWGYDGVFPFAVQHSYGGAQGLQRLVDACHAQGLAVVLDVVYNHFGPEGSSHSAFAPYFTDKYKTPWGNAINFDDAGCDGVRHYFIENTLMWFRDFHIDALRFDAVHAIKDFGALHILRSLQEQVAALSAATGRTHYLIIECDLNDPKYIAPPAKSGYGMHAQWMDEFHHALRVAAGQEQTGYYSDFNGIAHLAKSYSDAYVYDGIYSPHRQRTFGAPAKEHPGEQFVVFSQNHDQVGNRMLGERTSTLVNFELQKLMAAAVFVSPYLPMLFMGEEWSAPHPFLYFVDHSDPELAEAVRKGRRDEFRAFHAEGEAPDPLAEQTYHQSRLQWDLMAQEPHAAMLRYYRALIDFRKNYLPLKAFTRDQLRVHVDTEKQTLLLHRWANKLDIICCLNFSDTKQTFSMDGISASLRKLLDSADPQWKGPLASPSQLDAVSEITVQPHSCLVYQTHV